MPKYEFDGTPDTGYRDHYVGPDDATKYPQRHVMSGPVYDAVEAINDYHNKYPEIQEMLGPELTEEEERELQGFEVDVKAPWSLRDEERAIDPETGGAKGRKLEEFALVPVWPRQEVARVYGMGAKKYEPNNWRRGYAWSWSLSALHRHIALFEAGESTDPESGLHHLAHAQFHLNTLMEFERLGLGTDDRQI